MKKKAMVFGILGAMAAVASIMSRQARKPQVKEFIEDSSITARIKAKLAEDDLMRGYEVSVETVNGRVQLSGFVDSSDYARKAEEIAKTVQGVKSIHNSLVVR